MKSHYRKITSDVPTCVDLFAGAGGLTLGFTQAGGIPLASVDNDLLSTQTYKRMFPFVNDVHHGNIEKWKPNPSTIGLDVLIGGPPCQGFSLARGTRFVDDPRNILYKEFVRSLKILKPKYFVMENVQGIINIGDGIVLTNILEDFDDLGYTVEVKVINMAEYGVPQSRRRAIFLGSKNKSINWPKPEKKLITGRLQQLDFIEDRPLSVFDAIGDLPWPNGKYIAHRANSQMRGPRNRILTEQPAFTLRTRADEFGIRDDLATGPFAPTPVEEFYEFVDYPKNDFQEFMQEDAPHWCSWYSGPKRKKIRKQKLNSPRRLSIRELARLQTFPDWFQFSGSPYQQGKQIGNAVPPLFAKKLFEVILNY